MPRAVVLLSGGLDSATVLAIAQSKGFECYTLCVDYGQRHQVELEAARNVAGTMGARYHHVVKVSLRDFGGSALTAPIDVPKNRDDIDIATGIPITYVPARNTVMLSLALAWAEVLKAYDIFVGVNAIDYSGYPDCRPEFIAAFENLANLATKEGVEGHRFTIHAPLVDLTKPQIIEEGLRLGVNYAITHSCYDPRPDGSACGACDSCLIRRHAFEELGMTDPAR